MSTDDKYGGWTNRETWTLNLWLGNDEGLSSLTHERVDSALVNATEYFEDRELDPANRARFAGEAVKELWEEIADPDNPHQDRETRVMIAEVGSAWRINWDEIGAAWLEDQS